MDLKTMAISRLMLDNFSHIKAYWVMLGIKTAQISCTTVLTTSMARSSTKRFTTTPVRRCHKR